MSRKGHRREPARAANPVRRPARTTRVAVWALLLVVVGFAAYWNSLTNPFLLDDELSVVRNPQIRDVGRLWDVLSPPRTTPVAGRPLVNLSFALNYAVGGLEVRGYHLVNIGIHVLAALVLFGVLRRTLSLPAVRARLGDASTHLAGASTLIWMIHPLQTEAVSYLTQRTESMMGLFYLLTLYCSIRAAEARGAGRWTAAAGLACLLGVTCKESMVTAPLVVVLYDRIFLFDSWRESLGARWRLYSGLAVNWIALALLLRSGPRADSVGFSIGTSAWTYLLNQTIMVRRYVSLSFWPHALVIDYGPPFPFALSDVMLPASIVAGLLLATGVALFAKPRLGFLGAWFFITLAPTTSVVPIVTEVGAERRMYLPLAAIVVLVVVLVVVVARALAARFATGMSEPLRSRALTAAGACLLVTVAAPCLALTAARNREYASTLSMATTNVARWPHGRARFTLGTELIAAGRREEGMNQLWDSAETYPGARFALGTELITSGQTDAGLAELQRFVRDQPQHVNVIPARELIGRTFLAMNRLDEAADQFRQILQVAPYFVDAYAYLGDVFLAQHRYGEAVDRYSEFLKQRPTSARALEHMGLALAATGRLGEAVPFFERTIAADPGNVDARRNLVRALLETGRPTVAAARAEEALALQPDDATVHNLLGMALASDRKLDEAVEHFRRAVALDPGNAEARDNLARASRIESRGR